MAEPTSTSAIALTAGGLALFGVVTGLHPALLLAGLAGGWWALSLRTEPLPLVSRLSSAAISSISAAWAAPVAMALLASFSWWPEKAVPVEVLQFPVALMLGRFAHTLFGASLDAFLKRKLEGGA